MNPPGLARRTITALLMIVVAAAVALGLVEGLTRLLFPAFDPSGRFEFRHRVGPLHLGQPGVTQRQIKNTGDYDVAVAINRHGLRDARDIAGATPDDLVVVGDSFAWGWGVQATERVSDQLQSLTNKRVYNCLLYTSPSPRD